MIKILPTRFSHVFYPLHTQSYILSQNIFKTESLGLVLWLLVQTVFLVPKALLAQTNFLVERDLAGIWLPNVFRKGIVNDK